jgi:hypothetical protein
MIIEKVQNGIRYRLSNEDLKVSDSVFPIAHGRTTDDGLWLLHDLDFRYSMSGFPDRPDRIESIELNEKRPDLSKVQTNCGYSPIGCYFKIIKKEQHKFIKKPTENFEFTEHKWVEIPL